MPIGSRARCREDSQATTTTLKNRCFDSFGSFSGCVLGSPKPIHLKPGHLKMAFFTARCFPCGISLERLGGHFGPEKKKISPPPPKIPQFAADTLPALRPLLCWRPPPPLHGFSKKPMARPPASDSPFTLAEQKKIKISETSTKKSSEN